MRDWVFGLCVAAVALVMAGPAHAELMSFESDFTSWTGSDATATSPVTSTGYSGPPLFWTVTYDGATGQIPPGGWLTQGNGLGADGTAKFYRTDITKQARARFSTPLPPEWVYYGLQDTTLQVDFKLRCDNAPAFYNGGGGPIQISYPTIYGMFTTYIRVRDQSKIQPLDSGTDNAPGVDTKTLSPSLGDAWHTWHVTATYGEYANYDGMMRHWVYWDVYLDDTDHLLFGGTNGSQWFNGHQYSFRTRLDIKNSHPGFGQTGGVLRGDGKIGLGEMRNETKVWGFEFDYVNFSADYVPKPPLTELYRWDFDDPNDPHSQNWNCMCHPYEIYSGCDPAPPEDIVRQDKYGTPPNDVFVNLMERDPADWPWGGVNPTEGGALYWQVAAPGMGMWLLNGVKIDLAPLAGNVMAIEFNLSATIAPYAYDIWVDFYIREPVSPYRWARLRSRRLSAEGSNQFDPWKWSRTRYNLAEFPDMELIVGDAWWTPSGLNNLNGLFAVDIVADAGTEGATPAFLDDIRLYGPPLPCSLVTPEGTQALTVPRLGEAGSIVYTFTHNGLPDPVSYTVGETDAAGSPLDYPWLSLNKAGGGPLSSGQSDTVTVTTGDVSGMTPGTYTAYITFAVVGDACEPPENNKHIRRTDVTIVGCQAEVLPSTEIARSCIQGSGSPVQDAVFTVKNTGENGLTYGVVKVGDCPWLSLDKTEGGPLDYQQTDAVTATINPAGLATGVYACTLRFADSCSPAVEYDRDVVLSVFDASTVLQQFDAEFVDFTGTDLVAESPFDRCDPGPATGNIFTVTGYSGNLIIPGRISDYLTQGSIDDTPTTAKFSNPSGSLTYGHLAFDGNLPFDESYDPANGMVVAWRMRVGNYAPGFGPIQIMAPTEPGPYTTGVPCYNCFIRLSYGTQVRILNNDGNSYPNIVELLLDTSIANEYHQWTAAVCCTDAAYWKLWLDGELLLFGGSDGSVIGPAGETYSFRTASATSSLPLVRLGEQNRSSSFTNGWDFEFDFVRALSLNVTGSPFWDGEGCPGGCPTPFADADGDGDVDQSDFAAFQVCMTGDGGTLDPVNCACFDRDGDDDVDGWDLADFEACASGPDVPWTPTPGCP